MISYSSVSMARQAVVRGFANAASADGISQPELRDRILYARSRRAGSETVRLPERIIHLPSTVPCKVSKAKFYGLREKTNQYGAMST